MPIIVDSTVQIAGIMPRHSNAPRINANSRLAILLLLSPTLLLAQPSLRITSPADGAVFHPGDSLKVKVEASGKFQLVFVIAGSIGMVMPPLSAPPYEFTSKIPDDVVPDQFGLNADGVIEPGRNARPPVIWIQVEEPDDAPLRLGVDHADLEMYADSGGIFLAAEGEFPGGRKVTLNRSMYVAFKSSDTRIATVSPDGVVVPVAAGSAKIVITYRDSRIEVPVTVHPKPQR